MDSDRNQNSAEAVQGVLGVQNFAVDDINQGVPKNQQKFARTSTSFNKSLASQPNKKTAIWPVNVTSG